MRIFFVVDNIASSVQIGYQKIGQVVFKFLILTLNFHMF